MLMECYLTLATVTLATVELTVNLWTTACAGVNCNIIMVYAKMELIPVFALLDLQVLFVRSMLMNVGDRTAVEMVSVRMVLTHSLATVTLATLGHCVRI